MEALMLASYVLKANQLAQTQGDSAARDGRQKRSSAALAIVSIAAIGLAAFAWSGLGL
jgi:hypothetical protein